MNPAEPIAFNLKTLTPIWTGGVERNDNSKLHITGLKGSIRWWYEALVRGLGAYACDPTSSKEPKKCELKIKELPEKTDTEIKKQLCPACYLFGCRQFNEQVQHLGLHRSYPKCLWRDDISN